MPYIDQNKTIFPTSRIFITKIRGGFKDYWDNLKLFNKNVRLYLLASFLIGLTFASYNLLLNLYLREQQQPESFIGTILSAGAIGMAVSAIPSALIIRKIKLKLLLVATTVVYVCMILLLVWLPVSGSLVFVAFFAGLSLTFYRVASSPFFMRNSTPRERTYIFSLFFGVMLLASTAGSAVFGVMVAYIGKYTGSMIMAYRWTFVVAGGLGLLAVIPFSLIKAKDPKEDKEEAEFSLSLIRRRIRLYFKLFAPYFVVGTGAGLIIPFLNIYFRDRFGAPPDQIGIFYTAVHATMFIGIMAGPVLAKKLGMVRSMVSTQLISIPFMLILAFTYSLPLAVFAFLIRGALMNLGNPIGRNFSMEMVSKPEQPLVNALLMLGWTSSWMISTKVGGILIENHGYTPVMLITVVLYIASSILYFVYFRNSEKKEGSTYRIEMPD